MPARFHRKRQKVRCLRRRTSRFWIIRFNTWRNRKRKIIAICWRNWDGWFRSVRNLSTWEFWVTKRTLWSRICERTRRKWVRIKTGFLYHSITRIWKSGRNTKTRNRHRYSRFNRTVKIWDLEWSLSTKLDLWLEFSLKIARQALEARLLSELEEKDGTFFTRADATLDLIALGKKQEFWVEVVPNWKREWIMTVFKMKVFPKYLKQRKMW